MDSPTRALEPTSQELAHRRFDAVHTRISLARRRNAEGLGLSAKDCDLLENHFGGDMEGLVRRKRARGEELPPALADFETHEDESPEHRAARLCREVQRGYTWEGYLHAQPRHIMHRHVGKTDAELLARGRRESSTFENLWDAEWAIAGALQGMSSDIDAWLASSPTLPQNFSFDLGRPIGRVIDEGGHVSVTSELRIVLFPLEGGYRIKNAFPVRRIDE